MLLLLSVMLQYAVLCQFSVCYSVIAVVRLGDHVIIARAEQWRLSQDFKVGGHTGDMT